MVALPKHLQIINPLFTESYSFPSFNRLPAELRLEIWRLSLQRSRIITIKLSSNAHAHGQLEVSQSPYTTRNNLGRVISGTHYQVTAHGSQLLSKLLRVNSEARQAALQFHRVHIPCRFELADREGYGTLLLNPEFDILYIRPDRYIDNLVDFFHDLRAFDPRNVGLLNLALDPNGTGNLKDITIPAKRESFIDIIVNLRQVYFVCLEKAGRLFLGPLCGIPTVTGLELHRSRPIMSTIPTFDRIPLDPRDGISRDLGRVFIDTFDPREMVFEWRAFLYTLRTDLPPVGPEYRFLVANGWGGGRGERKASKITNREGASEYLGEEEERWLIYQKRQAAFPPKNGLTPTIETPEDLEHAPRPAIGFWLFPVEALGPMTDPWVSKRLVDMGQYWPELCLQAI